MSKRTSVEPIDHPFKAHASGAGIRPQRPSTSNGAEEIGEFEDAWEDEIEEEEDGEGGDLVKEGDGDGT